MLPVRLGVAKLLNDINPSRNSYQEVLQLETKLRAAYKQLCQSIQGLRHGAVSSFDSQFLDFIVRRYFLSLHSPWFGQSLRNAAFAHSRRIVIDTATRIWHMVSLDGDLALLSRCGAGFFRSIPIQSCLAIAIEIRAQLEEEESLGPRTPRPDLLATLQASRDWSLARVEAGSTNIKGYMSVCGLLAQIDAMSQNLSGDEIHKTFANSVEEALHRCLSVLQGISQKERVVDQTMQVDDDWELPDIQSSVADVESFFTFAPGWLVANPEPEMSIWQ
ncbi:hypothetical protein KJ359_006618 [Pestalotiopsis sp. 9143b]|nr:hypothetical protein KJ359_006618 [Pestalotiopsis sp. 9143b]